MADIKISQLGAAASISDSDVIPMTASGVTVKASAALLKEYAIGDTNISSLGDGSPTGAIDALNTSKVAKTDIAPIEASVATQNHAVGAEFYLSGVLMQATAAIAQGDQIVNGTNCAPANPISSDIQTLTNNVSDLESYRASVGAKNLCPTLQTQEKTSRNITYTPNADGSVSIGSGTTGTSASNDYIFSPTGDSSDQYLKIADYLDRNIDYILKCSETDKEFDIGILLYDSNYTYLDALTTRTQIGFNISTMDASNQAVYFSVRLRVAANKTIAAGTVAYPMIVDAREKDLTWAPNAKTNRQLTVENQTLSNKTNAIDTVISTNGAKNILPYDYNAIKSNNAVGTWSGDTYTVGDTSFTLYDNGIVDITRTQTESENSDLWYLPYATNFMLPAGKYVLSGTPPQETLKVRLRLRKYENGSWVNIGYEEGTGLEFTLTSKTAIALAVQAMANSTAFSNYAVRPMITLADQPNSDYAHYVPYAKTNRELTLADVGTYNVPVIMGKEQSTYVRGAIIYGDKLAQHTVTINEVKQFADSTDYTSQFQVDYSTAGFAIIYTSNTALAGALMKVNVTVL